MLLLMIDDDQDFVTVWRHILLQEGFDVAAAMSVAGAKRFLAHKQPDVILCDANVADLNMPSFCQQLTDSSANRQTPIIITGEIGNSQMQNYFLRSGAVGYLAKPFRRDELVQALKSALSQTRHRYNDEGTRNGDGPLFQQADWD